MLIYSLFPHLYLLIFIWINFKNLSLKFNCIFHVSTIFTFAYPFALADKLQNCKLEYIKYLLIFIRWRVEAKTNIKEQIELN